MPSTALYANVSSSARKRTASGFNPLTFAAQVGLPGAVAIFALYKFVLKKGKKSPAAGQPDAAPKKQTTAAQRAHQKARKNVKVKRDPEAAAQARAIAREQAAMGLTPDNEMEALNEDEVEQLHAAEGAGEGPVGPGGPGGNDGNFIKMLQSLGYKMVVANDGSGQVFMIPPGADGPPGPEGIEEGDEEGYDEDEDGEEGEEEDA